MIFDWPYIIAGTVVGTMGWVIYLAGLPAIGLVCGVGSGAILGFTISGTMTAAWAPVVLTSLGGVMGGALGFWMMRVFQLYLFFAVGACLGGALGFQVSPFVEQLAGVGGGLTAAAAIGLGALLGGLLCVRMRRYIVAIITSAIGTFLILPGLPVQWQAPGLIVVLVIFLAIQVGLVRRFVNKEAFDRRTRVRMREDRPDVDPED